MEFKFGRLSLFYVDCMLSIGILNKDQSHKVGFTVGPCMLTLDRDGDIAGMIGWDLTRKLPKWIGAKLSMGPG